MMTNPLQEDLEYILFKTPEIWECFKDKSILLTGGTGFFGCWLLESCVWAIEKLHINTTINVLTRSPEKFINKVPHLCNNKSVKLLKGDILDFELPNEKFDFIIHAATDASAQLNQENPLLMFETVLTGTKRMLELAKRCNCQKFLLTSSGAVYGKQPSNIHNVPETFLGGPDPLDPHWAYGEGKRAAEQLCAIYQKQFGIECKIARCFAFVGPYLPLDIHFAIGNFIRDGMFGGSIRINGDGTPYRSYLYAADLVIALLKILINGKSCRAYNVGSPDAFSILEIAQVVASQVNPKPEIIVSKSPIKGELPSYYVPSIARIQEELNVFAEVPFEHAIRKTIEWNKINSYR